MTTLSWTNTQLKRRKYFHCFCTDTPGIFCYSVIHWSQAEPQQLWHCHPLSHNIHSLWVSVNVIYQQIHFLQYSQVLGLAHVSQHIQLFSGLEFGDPQSFPTYVPLLVVFWALQQQGEHTGHPGRLSGEPVGTFALTVCSGKPKISRRLHVLGQLLVSTWSPTRGYMSPSSLPAQLSCFQPCTKVSPCWLTKHKLLTGAATGGTASHTPGENLSTAISGCQSHQGRWEKRRDSTDPSGNHPSIHGATPPAGISGIDRPQVPDSLQKLLINWCGGIWFEPHSKLTFRKRRL